MARSHGIAADEAQLKHEFGPEPFTADRILLAAKFLGMTAKIIKQDPDRLDRAPLPAIAIDKEGNFFIAVKYGFPVEIGDQPPQLGEGTLYFKDRYSIVSTLVLAVILAVTVFVVIRIDVKHYLIRRTPAPTETAP